MSVKVPASKLPTTPTGVNASDGTANYVTISWIASSRTDYYSVYRSTVSGQSGTLVASVVNGLVFIDPAATLGTIYYYSVRGHNSYGYGPFSAQDAGSALPLASVIPAQPSFISASDGTDTFVTILWGAAARSDSYQLYRSAILGQSGNLIATVPATTLTVNDVSAVVGQTYYYSVRGVNTYGPGLFTGQNAGYVTAVVPPPPAETLTTASTNPTGETITVYNPTDSSAGRAWVSAPLRSQTSTLFSKWQKDGVDYDTASTTSVLLDTPCTMTAVYVAAPSTGVAVAPGTDTLAAAMVGKPAGTTYLLQAGIHRMTAEILPLAGDTIQGANGAKVRGSKVITFVTSGSVWKSTGQTQDFFAEHGDGHQADCAIGSPLCYRRECVYIDNVKLSPVGSGAALVTGTFFFDYPNDTIYIFDNPSGKTVETTIGCGGFIGFGNYNVTLRNLIIEQFGTGEDYAGGRLNTIKAKDGWLVEHCEIHHNGFEGVQAFGTAVIRNNYIHHNGQYGIVAGAGTGVLIEGNVVSFNNTDGFDALNNAGGTKFLHSTNMRIRGNRFLSNFGMGGWSDYDNHGTTYENNICTDNTYYGIDNEVNVNTIIRYNVFSGNCLAKVNQSLWNQAAIWSRSSKNFQVYGNDITAPAGTHGITVRWDQSYTTPQDGTFGVLDQAVSVHDNVIRLGVGSQTGYVGNESSAVTQNIVNFSNNNYIVPSLGVACFIYNSAPLTFTQWQAGGHDTTGTIAIP